MNYGNIPEEVLNIVIARDLYSQANGEFFDLSLKDELKLGEDIEFAIWKAEDGVLFEFNAWTKNYVLFLVPDPIAPLDCFVDKALRNPPNV